MRRTKIISFDLEGTLVDASFSHLVWEVQLPALYAEEKGVDAETAVRRVMKEYDAIGPERLEWYDLQYWFRRFQLKTDWRSLLERCRGSIRIYPESREVLRRLSLDHDLVIISNSSRDFIHPMTEGLEEFFTRIFSAPTDFSTLKFTELYLRICRELAADPQDIVHTGDHSEFDYIAPREAGVTAFLLDRTGKQQGDHVVRDLWEFEKKISQLDSCQSRPSLR